MVRFLLPACVLVCLVLQPPVAAVAEPLPAAAEWIPQDAVFMVEVPHPDAVFDLALDPKVVESVTSVPAYRQQMDSPGYKQFRAIVAMIELQLGTDWQTAARTLTGGGVTLAAFPNEGAVLIVDAKDPKMLANLHDFALSIAKGEAAKRGTPEDVAPRDYRGVTGWRFGPDEAHAIIGSRLVVANRPELLRAVVDVQADENAKSLADLPAYREACQAVDPKAAARVFVNLTPLKQTPGFKAAFDKDAQPLVALLFSTLGEAVENSDWLALALRVEERALALSLTMDGKADAGGAATFALPDAPDRGALPNLDVPRRIAGVSLYRDLHAFYAAKDDLFPQRTSGLIFFENMMGIFFSGLDLTEEVLGETEPEIRLVVAAQQYDPEIGTPQTQLPAFAAVFRMTRPDHFAAVAEEAWQKGLGLINFTRGQQALPGLIIDRHDHGGVRYSMAYFRAPGKDERTDLPVRYNTRPALARCGEYLILSSTDGLTEDLIDALQKEAAGKVKPSHQTHSLLQLDGRQLASILAANRNNLVQQNMLKEGNTKPQAEAAIDMLLLLVGSVGSVEVDLGTVAQRPVANLQLQLNLP